LGILRDGVDHGAHSFQDEARTDASLVLVYGYGGRGDVRPLAQVCLPFLIKEHAYLSAPRRTHHKGIPSVAYNDDIWSDVTSKN
jgi:hypothetical protein